jgi:hypothetical protein
MLRSICSSKTQQASLFKAHGAKPSTMRATDHGPAGGLRRPTDDSQSGFAVPGLVNSASFVGCYDRRSLEVRTAENWSDECLPQFG